MKGKKDFIKKERESRLIFFKKNIFLFLTFFSLLISEDSNKTSPIKKINQDSLDLAVKQLLEDIKKVPNFSLNSLEGDVYNIRSLEGKVVLLNFWATWCGPCRMEIPELNEMQEKYGEDNFIILGISTSDTKKALKNFTRLYEVGYPLLYGTPKEIDKILREYGGIYSLPTSILINKKGENIFSYPGAILKAYDRYDGVYSTLNKNIEKALKENIEK